MTAVLLARGVMKTYRTGAVEVPALRGVDLDSGAWFALARRAPRGGLPLRLGLAHPLARPFRTAMQTGMFALVLSGLVFMRLFAHLWQEQAPRASARSGPGTR